MAIAIASGLERVRERIDAAATRAGRDPASVRLIAVTKEVSLDEARAVLDAGATDLGENRAQQLAERAEELPAARWHFVGPLQTNKVRYLDRAALVHSLSRTREAAALQAHAEAADRTYDVLVQVNVAGEQQKHGVAPDDLDALLESLAPYQRVKPRGFMFMAPMTENPEDVRWVFAAGAKLKEKYERFGLEEISMGMTDDFEVAIEEGATMVRVGRAIFAPPHRDEDN